MIDILIATYNSEKFIDELFNSIVAQSYCEWQVVVQDDCSSDSTTEIVSSYCEKYPGKFKLFVNEKGTGSAKANFLSMLKRASAEYIMFCDHDDVWLPKKIEKTLEKMQELERDRGENVPILVHSDLTVVDKTLNILHKSFFAFQGLNGEINAFNRLLCQNNVTGCTMMINKPLLKKVGAGLNVEKILMHDWWFALLASAFGKIGFINEPLILYRQHGENEVGAVNNRSFKGIMRIISNRSETRRRLTATYIQAQMFADCYSSMMDDDLKKELFRYASLTEKCKVIRIYTLLRYNYKKQNLPAIIGQIIFC